MGSYGFKSFQLDDVAFLIDGSLSVQGSDALIASGQTSALTPSHRIPPGTVIVKESGDGKFYLADAADGASAGDINTVALVSSAEAPDGDWASKVVTWSVTYPSGGVASGTVTLGGDDDTVGEVVTALNADASFRNHLVASANTILEIRSLVKGLVSVRISVNLTTAYGTVSGSSSYTVGTGTEADYRVTTAFAELKDINATAQDFAVPTLVRGRFRTSALSNLSAEAKAVLMRRGSIFE